MYRPSRRATLLTLAGALGLLAAWETLATARFFIANDWTEARWDAEADRIELPFELHLHVLVPVHVNGSGPFRFVLDTGSPVIGLIGNSRTERLRLPLGRRLAMGGSGTGATPYGQVVNGLTLSFRTTHLLGQTALWMPAEEVPFLDAAEEAYMDGIIGYDLLRRYVVDLDFEQRLLTLHRPESFEYRGPGEVFELEMHLRKPYTTVEATLENGDTVPVKLHVDLGNRGVLSLIPGSRPEITIPTKAIRDDGMGLSGTVEAYLGRVRELRLGSYRLENVLSKFPVRGHATAGDRQGVLSLGVLERFRVIFDYPNERMILEKTAQTNEPFEADMSGLRITPFADTWIVKEVTPSTPGAEAGFRSGDVLHSLDGVPATQFSYEKLHHWLRRDGASGEICVDRDGTTACREIRLRRRI